MVRITSDTSTLYSSAQAKSAGFDLAPLSVHIGGKSFREFDEIGSEDFVAMIRDGNMPTSSQPAIGDVAEMYERYPDDDILNISMAMGLSGTYDSAVAAASLCENSERITVLNSRTLCGPHRFLVEKAVSLAKEGHTVRTIVERLESHIESAKSFLIPADFEYLRRGGRLSPLVSHVGQVVNLVPIMTQTEDGSRLTVANIRRGFNHALKFIDKAFENHGVGKGWRIYITHADAKAKAEQAVDFLKEHIPDAVYEILPLSPVFITQGGPGCVAVQAISE